MFAVSEHNHNDVKILPLGNTDSSFLQRYESMYAMNDFILCVRHAILFRFRYTTLILHHSCINM